MNDEQYICVCGKSFQTKKSLGHHKTHCKCFQQQKKEKQLEQLKARQLPNGMFKCENCGNEHDGSYGSGRFCSKHCRCSFNGAKVKHGTLKQKCSHKNMRASYGTWKCEYCDDHPIFETRRKLEEHKRKFHPIPKGSSWNKGLTKESDTRIAQYVQTNYERNQYGKTTRGIAKSTEQRAKISASMKKFYKEHPELVPYKLHHSSKESYPERYFNELFAKENIVGFEHDYYVDGYYLDYAFVDKKIDFEVDGSQHYVDPKIVEHDKVRTQYLESLGWKTFRIDWRAWQKMNHDQKHEMIEQLKKMI